MNDLRALLGDRYAPTIQAAVLADNPDAITSAQRVGGKLGQLMYLAAVDRLDRVLAAVLPDLLAAAWDEGHRAGCSDPYARYGECDCGPNPYRAASGPEPAPGDAYTAGPATDANPDPTAPQKPKEARP